MPEPSTGGNDSQLNSRAALALGVYLLLLFALLVYLLLAVWFNARTGAATPESGICSEDGPCSIGAFGWTGAAHYALWRAVLMGLAGGIGTFLGMARRFAPYVGRRTLTRSWVWWVLLRTPSGMVLAFLCYFFLRTVLIVLQEVLPMPAMTPGTGGYVAVGLLAGTISIEQTRQVCRTFLASLHRRNARSAIGSRGAFSSRGRRSP